ncbi:MAG: NAD-dependent succinate-semialdehyde dehydrogenase [Bdellovibrionales bacterium]
MIRTINPTTGEVLEEYSFQDQAQVEKQLEQGHLVFQDWSRQTLTRKLGALQRFEAVLRGEREALARSMTLEMGKPIRQSLAEVDKCVLSCTRLREEFPQWIKSREYHTSKGHHVHYTPLGVLLGVMPWNFPVWQVVRFAVPALLNGNVILLKHAPSTWGTARLIEKAFQESFPEDIYQRLEIDVPQIEPIVADPRVRGVSLTGSKRAGSALASIAGKYIKKTVLELGGSDAYLILEDADVELAVEKCTEARLQNTGQSCIAAKRFIIHKRHYTTFIEKFAVRMGRARVGDPLNENTDVGPMARLDLREELDRQVKKSVATGSKIVIGGEVASGPGCFYPPTILKDVRPGQVAFDEELFGPVAACVEAHSDREALQLANESKYGLGGAIFSRDVDRARQLAVEEFDTGMVGINDMVRSDVMAPFGGVKDSGLGRELGIEGCFEFCNVKTVILSRRS